MITQPLWLAPEQVRVIPLTEKELTYAQSVHDALRAADFRVSLDEKSERMGAKIRRAQKEKVPYMLVVGPKELEEGTVAVRHRSEGDGGAVPLNDFLARLTEECKTAQQ